MLHDRLEWLRRIKAVEREYSATRLATNRLLAAADHDPSVLKGEMTLRDIGHASEHLDGTYIIRLFAEFETALRLFWPAARKTDPPSRARDLLDGVAANQRIPHDQLMNAHVVEEATTPVSIARARSHLCRFLSFLPPTW